MSLQRMIDQKNANLRTLASLAMKQQTEAIKSEYRRLDEATKLLESDIELVREAEAGIAAGAQHRADQQAKETQTKVNLLPEIAAQLARGNHSTAHFTPNTDKRAAINQAVSRVFNGKGLTAEQRDLVSGIDTDGGANVPQEFLGSFVEALKFYGPIAGKALLHNTDNGRPTKVPVVNDTANGMLLLGETDNSGASVDPILFSNLANTDALVSVLDLSFNFSDDVFDLDTLLNTIAASRVGRTIEKAITNGKDFAGNVLTNAPTGGLIAAAGNAGTVAAVGAVSYADAVKLHSSVDPAYRANGYFYAHQSVNDYLAAQVLTTGEPLYKVSDAGNLILVQGKELLINQAMPALTSTAGVAQMAFGRADKALAYTLRDVRVQILQPNVENLTKRAILSVRFGAAILDAANAVKVINS